VQRTAKWAVRDMAIQILTEHKWFSAARINLGSGKIKFAFIFAALILKKSDA
jgi:hypothetical protein